MLWLRQVGAALAVLLLLLTSAAAQGASRNARVGPLGRHLLAVRGIWTYFEDRNASFGWHAGQLLHVIRARSVQDEVTLQLREMRTMGVNEITYELRTGTGPWPVRGAFPDCELAVDLGPRWPQPDPDEIAGLRTLFGLIARQNMRVM